MIIDSNDISCHTKFHHVLGATITNRRLKGMLINHFGDSICFTYPKDQKESQMIFSTSIKSTDIAETLRQIDSIKECAKQLHMEAKLFDFELEGSFKSAEDVDISNCLLSLRRPQLWDKFFDIIFPQRTNSMHVQRKCDAIFQIVHYIIHNGHKQTPLHISLAELIHDNSRSKILIEILNKLGLCIGYHEMEKIDMGLAKRVVDIAGSSRVPVPPIIQNSLLVHGAMDNFDHDERTLSGIGGSHDTILMLFQNAHDNVESNRLISQKPVDLGHDQQSLNCILPCQKLLKSGTFGGRGNISDSFTPGEKPDFSSVVKDSAMQYRLWTLLRQANPLNLPTSLTDDVAVNIPSFSAMRSLTNSPQHLLTKCAFTPILPHPATDEDTIFTTMVNFQDVLEQKQLSNGPLWSDEGVYRIAKEIQLRQPDKFSNIFLGLGGFHLEKVILGCLGPFLEPSGIKNVLIKHEIFGPGVANSVMSGGDYVRSKRGMSLIAEALEQLQMKAFLQETSIEQFDDLSDIVSKIRQLMKDPIDNEDRISELWNDCLEEIVLFERKFEEFKAIGCEKSEQFAYWNTFLIDIVPVLRDLTRSFREGNWMLHLSSVYRALALCFAFDRINYKRWLPLYYEDCLALPTQFPEIYEAFSNGDFVVRHSSRRCSAVPIDQALEKEYNKPAKSQSGIIGITRRKEAVCKWNIIKHEKAKYRTCLQEICQMSEGDEYSLHHEFSQRITREDQKSVSMIISYLLQRGNPFSTDKATPITNIAFGEVIEESERKFLLDCISLGETARDEFYKSRLVEKTAKLLDNIPKTRKNGSKKKAKQHSYDINKETVKFLQNIDYARLRNFDLKILLRSEIAPLSFFLMQGGYIRKPNKSELATELKRLLPDTPPRTLPSSSKDRAVIIDFMGYARKVPIKKQGLKTYSDFFESLWKTFKSISENCTRLDIVFDLYKDQSIKASERSRRATIEGIETVVNNADESLPVEIERFWNVAKNKVQFQQLFIKWIVDDVSSSEPSLTIFLGGCHKEGDNLCYTVHNGNANPEPMLECSHEEADDRVLFHTSHAVKCGKFESIVIASPDVDIFVNATHHYRELMCNGLKECWFLTGRSNTKACVPIHELFRVTGKNLVDILPAVHALTGCDSTSKFGTKSKAMQVALKNGYDLLHRFGREELSEEMIGDAERFLLMCASKHDVSTFDDLRYVVYHEKYQEFSIEKFPPTSASIREHILRAYLQTYMWVHAPFVSHTEIDPLLYGYECDDEGSLAPKLSEKPAIPDDFPAPCNCLKCATKVCPCRKREISCCQYCKCDAGDSCKNPF